MLHTKYHTAKRFRGTKLLQISWFFTKFGDAASFGVNSEKSAKVFPAKIFFLLIRESCLPRKFPAIWSHVRTRYTDQLQGALTIRACWWPNQSCPSFRANLEREEGKESATERNSQRHNALATQIIRSCTVTTDLMKSSRHCSW